MIFGANSFFFFEIFKKSQKSQKKITEKKSIEEFFFQTYTIARFLIFLYYEPKD